MKQILAIPLFLFVLIKVPFLVLWYALYLFFLSSLKRTFSNSSFPSWATWLYALSFAIPVVFFTAFLRFWPKTKDQAGNSQPILLIHGYMDDASIWTVFRKRLETEGFSSIYTMNLGSIFDDLTSYQNRVLEKVEEIAQVTKREDLILIGHSLGGVVASLVALKKPSLIQKVITLGSPLKGAHLAIFGLGKAVRQFKIGSKEIEELPEKIKQESKVRFFHLATKTDEFVQPFDSALIEGHPCEVLKDTAHVSFPFSEKAFSIVSSWLES